MPPVATHSCSSSPEKRTDLFADASNAANTGSGVDTVRKPGSMDEKPENFKIKPRFIPFTETEKSQLSGVGPKIAVSANHEESTSPGYIATTTDTSLRGAVKDNGLFTSTSTKAMDTFAAFSRKVTTVTSKTAHSLTTVAKGIAGGAGASDRPSRTVSKERTLKHPTARQLFIPLPSVIPTGFA